MGQQMHRPPPPTHARSSGDRSVPGWRAAAASGVMLLLAACNGQGDAPLLVPDPDFGDGGRAPDPFGPEMDYAEAVVLDGQDRILVAGGHKDEDHPPEYLYDDYTVVRYEPDGSIDHDFGDGGAAIVEVSDGASRAFSLAVAPDGRIVAAGNYHTYEEGFGVGAIRLDDGGGLDPEFAEDGIYYRPLGGESGDGNIVRAVIHPPSGGILLVGSAWSEASDNNTLLLRLNDDGTGDESFGDGGIRLVPEPAGASAAVLQPDDRIVAAGDTFDLEGYHLALSRFDGAGELDESFGQGGHAGWSDEPSAADMALREDGGLVVAGDQTVVAFTADGQLDAAFGGGAVPLDLPAETVGRAVAVDSQGRVLFAGEVFGPLETTSYGILARLLPDGTPDPTLGPEGWGRIEVGSLTTRIEDVVCDAQDRVIIVGWGIHDTDDHHPFWFVERYDP